MGEKEVQTGQLYIEGEPFDGNIRELPEDVELITEGSPCQCLPVRDLSASFELVGNAAVELSKEIGTLSDLFRKIAYAEELCRWEHPKWWHYFRYSKKLRIREKYAKRICQAVAQSLLIEG